MKQVAAQIVGREFELAQLDAFLESAAPSGAVVLVGGPGVGKTTLWEAGLAAARGRGCSVLAARPSGAEARLAFAGLIDLLDGVDVDAMASVPAPQRRALETALLRVEPGESPVEPSAVGLAFLNALRELGRASKLVVAVDDLQWLDAPSGEALVYAARRLASEHVVFVLARRPVSPSPLEQALESRVQTISVGPLSFGASRRMLAERLGLTLPRPLLRRIVDTTLGNPLFTLEIGRSLAEGETQPADDDLVVPEAVEEVLGTRVAGLPEELRHVLLAVALGGDLRVSELALLEGASVVDEAVGAGLVTVEGDRVRASHPLLPAVARGASRPGERRRMHRELAAVVGDSELRALHGALAAEHPDSELAATLDTAAEAAGARGAPREAVVLAEHALRITPPQSAERPERLLRLAAHLQVAGELQDVSDLLLPEVESFPPGAARARAFVFLSDGGANESNDDCVRHLERALAESEEAPLERAAVLAKLATNWSAVRIERVAEAEGWAEESLEIARGAEPSLERLALESLSWARSLRGKPVDDLCERFLVLSAAATHLAVSPERVRAQRLLWRGDVERARAELQRLLDLADARGEQVSYALLRFHLCDLELRAGGLDAASMLLDEWADTIDDQLLMWPMYERCRALLAAGRGSAEDVERWSSAAIEKAEATGVRWDRLEAIRATGIAALLAGDPAGAVTVLRAVSHDLERAGVEEPGAFPVAPDFVEALVEAEGFDEARAYTSRLARQGETQQHPWAQSTASRSAALVELAAAGYDEAPAGRLEQAAAAYRALGLRLDEGRTLLALGRARRRARKWGGARRTLEAAAAVFDASGAEGWAELARAELSRVGARKPQAQGGLTPTEQRVAELAVSGKSNKEIAQALFVTVNTVEAHLSHAYAKLGVRSRGQLSRVL